MKRENQLNVRMSPDDYAMLGALAAHEERQMSDTVRRLIRRAFEASGLKLPSNKKAKP